MFLKKGVFNPPPINSAKEGRRSLSATSLREVFVHVGAARVFRVYRGSFPPSIAIVLFLQPDCRLLSVVCVASVGSLVNSGEDATRTAWWAGRRRRSGGNLAAAVAAVYVVFVVFSVRRLAGALREVPS